MLSPLVGHAEDDDKIWDAVYEISQHYDKLEYEKAFTLIQGARRLPLGVEGAVTLSLYEGIILCEMGQLGPSRAAFREALLMRPGADLPEDVGPNILHFFEAIQLEVSREKAALPAPRKPVPEAHPSKEEEEQDATVQADTEKPDGEASEKRTVPSVPETRTPASAEPPVSASPLAASQTNADLDVE